MVGVNVSVPAPVAYFPFAGWRGSFYGDLHATGRDGVDFYTERKVVTTRWPWAPSATGASRRRRAPSGGGEMALTWTRSSEQGQAAAEYVGLLALVAVARRLAVPGGRVRRREMLGPQAICSWPRAGMRDRWGGEPGARAVPGSSARRAAPTCTPRWCPSAPGAARTALVEELSDGTATVTLGDRGELGVEGGVGGAAAGGGAPPAPGPRQAPGSTWGAGSGCHGLRSRGDDLHRVGSVGVHARGRGCRSREGAIEARCRRGLRWGLAPTRARATGLPRLSPTSRQVVRVLPGACRRWLGVCGRRARTGCPPWAAGSTAAEAPPTRGQREQVAGLAGPPGGEDRRAVWRRVGLLERPQPRCTRSEPSRSLRSRPAGSS